MQQLGTVVKVEEKDLDIALNAYPKTQFGGYVEDLINYFLNFDDGVCRAAPGKGIGLAKYAKDFYKI